MKGPTSRQSDFRFFVDNAFLLRNRDVGDNPLSTLACLIKVQSVDAVAIYAHEGGLFNIFTDLANFDDLVIISFSGGLDMLSSS